ncbi:MAG: type VI secretion system baseplate subunit TssG [Burkholderiaceae bacterium]|jgi:type VI secretion system protein ImpH|nr:type VI secretion system baseplate subunit TssG [Burkholderiaceae bacterium]
MQTPQRRIDPPVIRQLEQEPWRFGFFQAVRLLELVMLQRFERDVRQRLVPGERMVPQRLRFRNSMNLSFPPSELASLTVRNAAGEVMTAGDWQRLPGEDSEGVDLIEIVPAFFGLLGGQGALPLHYTEMLLRHEQAHRDPAARAFLDIFTTRAATLFYGAWGKYRLPLHYEHERRRAYLPVLLSVAGLEHAAQREQLHQGEGTVFDETVAGYAEAIQHRPVSAVYLQRVLSDYFRVRVRVEQFVGKWYDVPQLQGSRLDQTNAVLGQTAMIGARVWQRDLRVRLWIGPLKRSEFRAFFPGKAHAKALEKMLGLLAGATCEYEVRLILAKEEVRSVTLNESLGGYLGWDSFLATALAPADRNDTSYELHPLR